MNRPPKGSFTQIINVTNVKTVELDDQDGTKFYEFDIEQDALKALTENHSVEL